MAVTSSHTSKLYIKRWINSKPTLLPTLKHIKKIFITLHNLKKIILNFIQSHLLNLS